MNNPIATNKTTAGDTSLKEIDDLASSALYKELSRQLDPNKEIESRVIESMDLFDYFPNYENNIDYTKSIENAENAKFLYTEWNSIEGYSTKGFKDINDNPEFKAYQTEKQIHTISKIKEQFPTQANEIEEKMSHEAKKFMDNKNISPFKGTQIIDDNHVVIHMNLGDQISSSTLNNLENNFDKVKAAIDGGVHKALFSLSIHGKEILHNEELTIDRMNPLINEQQNSIVAYLKIANTCLKDKISSGLLSEEEFNHCLSNISTINALVDNFESAQEIQIQEALPKPIGI